MTTHQHINNQATLAVEANGIPIPFSKRSLIFSNVIAAVLIAAAVAVPFFSLSLLWISAAVVAYILYCKRLSARAVYVSPTRLTIITRLGRRYIHRQEIRIVQVVGDVDLNWKLIPIPTLWGCNGMYRTPMLGRFTAYIGDPSLSMVRITMRHTSFIIATADSKRFMALLEENADSEKNT